MNRLSSPSLRTAAAILLLVLIAMPFWARNASSQAPEQEAEPIAQEEEITAPSSSTVPIFSYQGQLLDSDGNPITADLPMTFRLYDVATDGIACWTEEHSAANSINISNGLFHVLLGQITAIDTACLSADTYLELEINGEPLTPRELLTDVAKAVEAGRLVDGATALGELTVNGLLNVNSNSTTKIEGNLQVGNNSWTPTFAGMNGNDFAVEGQLEQYGSGGASFYKLAIGRDQAPLSNEGTLVTSGSADINGNLTLKNHSSITYLRLKSDNDNIHDWHIRVGGGGFFIQNDTENIEAIRITEAGNLSIDGNLSVGGTCSLSPVSMRMEHEGTVQAYSESEACKAGSITSGAYVEANLQTVAERRTGGNKLFSEGDLLCWGEDKLELCETPNDSLVQGVADVKGNPIVLGAEKIKVIGKVEKGDYLVASSVPGYAMASKNPTFGIVIAQALEDFEGEKGLIKAMIRKM